MLRCFGNDRNFQQALEFGDIKRTSRTKSDPSSILEDFRPGTVGSDGRPKVHAVANNYGLAVPRLPFCFSLAASLSGPQFNE